MTSSSKEVILPWKTFSDGDLTEIEHNYWIVRMGVVANRPKRHKKYEDSYVSLHCLTGDSKSTLGYSFKAKREFSSVFAQRTYLSLLSTSVAAHKKPLLVYDDQKVMLYRFNTRKDPSYWLLIRYRPST